MTRKARALAALAWMGGIWWLSDRPGAAFGELPFPQADKLVHLMLYAPLAWLWGRALDRPGIAWMIAVSWGVLDEWHQSWVPGRTPEFADLVVNAAGALVGVLVSRRQFLRRSD